MKGTTVLAASEFHSWSIGYLRDSLRKISRTVREKILSFWKWSKKKTKNNKKHILFFHCAARGVDKPAEDCELEPNNQSAVVSIVMLSPIGRGKNGKGTRDMSATASTAPVARPHK